MTLTIALLLGAECVAVLVAVAYILRRYSQLDDKAPFLTRLVHRDVRIALAGVIIGATIVYSLVRYSLPQLDLGPLLPPLGALAVGIPLAVLMYGPISDAVQWWKESL